MTLYTTFKFHQNKIHQNNTLVHCAIRVKFSFFILFDNHAERSRQVIAKYGNSIESHGQIVVKLLTIY